MRSRRPPVVTLATLRQIQTFPLKAEPKAHHHLVLPNPRGRVPFLPVCSSRRLKADLHITFTLEEEKKLGELRLNESYIVLCLVM